MVPETNGETSATGDQNARNESRRPTQVRYPDDIKRWLIGLRRRNDSRVLSTAAPMSSEAVREADEKKTSKIQRSATQQLAAPE
ncbi:hypothetical protein [Halosimplex salinum]|uniref:hypothetical protein n=1 Tax=Halosimplex salinum TaxID=1710538 RepID=UPI000F4AD1F3|nr:hypothetical protein [Halosimplex salinum]